jgi:hypothetical protein
VVDHEDEEDSEADAAEEVEEVSERYHEGVDGWPAGLGEFACSACYSILHLVA